MVHLLKESKSMKSPANLTARFALLSSGIRFASEGLKSMKSPANLTARFALLSSGIRFASED